MRVKRLFSEEDEKIEKWITHKQQRWILMMLPLSCFFGFL
jgi:hypothetical protein